MYQALFLESLELSYISIGQIPISALGAVIGISITIAALCGDDCTHRNCSNCHHPDLFPPPTSYIDSLASHISFPSLASHISFLSPVSLTSSHLSTSPEYYFAPLHTPETSPPPYVYSNRLLLPGSPRAPPGELVDGEFLSNTVLSLEYKSITIHWREFSGQECTRARLNWHVL